MDLFDSPKAGPSDRFEKQFASDGLSPVAGVDEAGRGPWAGPVVAAAVILAPGNVPAGLNDSKKLAAARREALFAEISDTCAFGIGIVESETIDEINILQATFRAMCVAVDTLPTAPAAILIDGNLAPPLAMPHKTIKKGDARSLSIAAASIVAKVTRDRLMVEMDERWPQYGFASHKGYGTARHAEALKIHGPCPAHRRSFKPVTACLTGQQGAKTAVRY